MQSCIVDTYAKYEKHRHYFSLFQILAVDIWQIAMKITRPQAMDVLHIFILYLCDRIDSAVCKSQKELLHTHLCYMMAYSLSTDKKNKKSGLFLHGSKFRARPACSKVIKKGLFKFKMFCE